MDAEAMIPIDQVPESQDLRDFLETPWLSLDVPHAGVRAPSGSDDPSEVVAPTTPNAPDDITFWPNLKARFARELPRYRSRPVLRNVTVNCAICREGPLRIHGIDLEQPTATLASVDEGEHALILPCGHIFGDKCMKTWRALNADPTCPMCGFNLVFGGCGDEIPGILAPFHRGSVNTAHGIPPTISEGGVVPGNCHKCEREFFIDSNANGEWFQDFKCHLDDIGLSGCRIDYRQKTRELLGKIWDDMARIGPSWGRCLDK